MDINQDRAYDLDLQSLLPPTPGAQGSVPAAHIDGWLGHVEPGGLRHDEIAVLGTRTSTVRNSNTPRPTFLLVLGKVFSGC